MKKFRLKWIGTLMVFYIFSLVSMAQEPVFPVRVSENGRYIVDGNNLPVFWLGTTQWQIFREYTLEEASTIIERSKDKGFIFIQAMLMGVGDGTRPNIYGQKPWLNDDPLTPNEAYFLHVDSVMQVARVYNVTISMTMYHQRYRKCITLENARAWAKWLSLRYRDFPNIVWSMTPEAKQEFIPVLRELVAGLREGDGGSHVITFKPDPSPYSSSFIHDEPWLDFNSMQTWNAVRLIYPMVNHDYNLEPVKPVLMAEGAYEQGSEYGFEVTPLWIRRQAYYSFLAGAHHTYGHNDSWRVLPTWKKALDAPGAVQMGVLRRILLNLKEWWYLNPDQSILLSGGNTEGEILNLAARHKDGKWIMIYLAEKSNVSVDLSKLATPGSITAEWIDPVTGKSSPAGIYHSGDNPSFTTPDNLEDAVLILR